MEAEAVTARLRTIGLLLEARGFVAKGVDMSPAAVTRRLAAQGALSDMCRALGAIGRGLQDGGAEGDRPRR
jgi:hypothetical protein